MNIGQTWVMDVPTQHVGQTPQTPPSCPAGYSPALVFDASGAWTGAYSGCTPTPATAPVSMATKLAPLFFGLVLPAGVGYGVYAIGGPIWLAVVVGIGLAVVGGAYVSLGQSGLGQ